MNPRQHPLCKAGMEIQTLLFPLSWSSSRIIEWCIVHGFKHNKLHEKGEHIRVRQLPPSHFKAGGFRTIHLGHGGIEAVVGCPK